MSEQHVVKQYHSFVRGLVTEASAINFPENASVDEANLILHRDGSRERRKGIDYETNYSKTSTSLATYGGGAVSAFSWENADNNPDKNFLVVQAGKHIDIFSYSSNGYGSSIVQFEIGVDTPKTQYFGSNSNLADNPISFVAVNGALFCSHPYNKPFYIKYDSDTETFSVIEYTIRVRDIWGVPLGVADSVHDRPTSLAGNDGWMHRYNLTNQGWPDEDVTMSPKVGSYCGSTAGNYNPIDQTIVDNGYAPSLSDSYWLSHGLMNTGVAPQNIDIYRTDMLTTNPLMQLRLPRGRCVIDAFLKNRKDYTSVVPSGQEAQDKASPSINASFAGRIWYAGANSRPVENTLFDDEVRYNSTLFFSQIMETFDHAGRCYQENDPTSKEFSDILDTDGGTIELAGAGHIRKMISLHNFLVVLADNGVWTVTGGPSGFTANSYAVRKVSNIGCISGDSAVEVEGSVVYWSTAGIYVLYVDAQAQDIRTENITENVIQSAYSAIPEANKKFARGFYDPIQRKVSWVYSSDTSFTGLVNKWKADRELHYDLVLSAWYPYTISSLAANTPYIMGVVTTPNFNLNLVKDDVVVGALDVEVFGDQVLSDVLDSVSSATSLVYILGNENGYTFGGYNNNTFYDWVSEDSTGVSYDSYLITGYEGLGDNARWKQAVYITCFFDRTEDQFIDDGSGGAILDNQSGCLMQARWDWADHSNSGKWGQSQQVYRLKRVYTPTGTLPEPFDNGQPVVVTRNKMRGRGRSSHIRFLSEEGKQMKLLGWQVEYMGKVQV